jgi:hypothetical protein
MRVLVWGEKKTQSLALRSSLAAFRGYDFSQPL